MGRLKRVFGIVAVTALIWIPLSGQVWGTECGVTYMSACATLKNVNYSGGTLTFEVINLPTTDPQVPPTSFIGYVLLLFSNPVAPPPDVAYVQYFAYDPISGGPVGQSLGGAVWTTSDPSGNIGGMGVEWNFGAKKDGTQLTPGILASFTVPGLSGDPRPVDDFAVHFQGMGIDGEDSDWTKEVPEPATMLLLVTGMLGIAGAARRRRNG